MNDQIVITGLGCINALAENAEKNVFENANHIKPNNERRMQNLNTLTAPILSIKIPNGNCAIIYVLKNAVVIALITSMNHP